jgi:hypothetical protein
MALKDDFTKIGGKAARSAKYRSCQLVNGNELEKRRRRNTRKAT